MEWDPPSLLDDRRWPRHPWVRENFSHFTDLVMLLEPHEPIILIVKVHLCFHPSRWCWNRSDGEEWRTGGGGCPGKRAYYKTRFKGTSRSVPATAVSYLNNHMPRTSRKQQLHTQNSPQWKCFNLMRYIFQNTVVILQDMNDTWMNPWGSF